MRGRLLARDRLRDSDVDQMFELMSHWFEGVTAAQFRRDLDDKNWVVWLDDDAGQLVGFSTLRIYPWQFGSQPATIVFSGDTIVAPRAWRSQLLAKTWGESVHHLHRAHGSHRLFWLLITSGFRTYRFLPVFFREFFPRHDRPTPLESRQMIEALAIERFGRHFDRSTGVVRFSSPQVLVDQLRGIPGGRLRDPHVGFFDRANPGHEQGDELVCLAEIARDNLTPAALRVMSRSQRDRRVEVGTR